jgi:hypothetical protein
VLGVPFYLCWEPNPECDATFEQLFESPDICLVEGTANEQIGDTTNALVLDATPYYDLIWQLYGSEHTSWENFRLIATGYLRSLSPAPHLREEVDRFTAQVDLPTAYGLHIRMTDNVTAYAWWREREASFKEEMISRLEGFDRFVSDTVERDPTAEFFLATDSQQAERYMVRHHSGRMVIYPKRYRSETRVSLSLRDARLQRQMQRTSRIEDALVEMLLLAKCRAIAGTYYSSFNEVAALIGGTKRYYLITGDHYVESGRVEELAGS